MNVSFEYLGKSFYCSTIALFVQVDCFVYHQQLHMSRDVLILSRRLSPNREVSTIGFFDFLYRCSSSVMYCEHKEFQYNGDVQLFPTRALRTQRLPSSDR